ncbi:MAG TPA: hypothetical protein VNC39_16515 [Acidocella sp.]|jgi:hypothetical protein|uniref:hypothetical protein n=1 Tax=Acidocella sp. TaxID=50710 RepID=UPI002BBDC9E5|nr:hypothetical protein [Acidocella sp.]HVE23572.1 hypothetical protein [Acidocella sp.]
MEDAMILSKKNEATHWLALAAMPGLMLVWSLAHAPPAAADSQCTQGAMQQNHVNARDGAANGTAQPMSRQTGNQPTSGPCHSSGQSTMQHSTGNQMSNPGSDEKHTKAAARVNQRTGAVEGPPAPLSNQKGNQPTSPVVH